MASRVMWALAFLGGAVLAAPATLWSQAQPKAAPKTTAKAPPEKSAPEKALPEKGSPAAKAPPKAASPDELAILKVGETYIAAFEKGDAAGVAACFTEDAEVFDITGAVHIGRAAIEKALTPVLAAQKGARLQLSVQSLRVQKSGVATEHGLSVESTPGAPSVVIQYTATYAKEAGAWKIAALRESWPEAPPAAGDLLAQELGWLVGAWTSGTAGKSARTEFSWSESGHFLLANHFAEGGGGRSALEIIAWDPANRQIRSWAFTADGGFGEGRWSREKNGWSVASQGVLPSGERTTTTYLFNRIDDKTLELRAVNRTVNGAVTPALPAVKLTRATAG